MFQLHWGLCSFFCAFVENVGFEYLLALKMQVRKVRGGGPWCVSDMSFIIGKKGAKMKTIPDLTETCCSF